MHDPAQDIIVRPRIVSTDVPGALPLLDELNEIGDTPGVIAIIGPAGSGKTTALRFLELQDSSTLRTYIDEPTKESLFKNFSKPQIVYAARKPIRLNRPLKVMTLAPWNSDDCIDYLLATDRTACARVMQRLGGMDLTALRGLPELLRVVLDALRAGEGGSLEEILRRRFDSLNPEQLECALKWCFATLLPYRSQSQLLGYDARIELGLQHATMQKLGVPDHQLRLMQHGAVQKLLAVELALHRLKNRALACYAIPWPRDLVRAVAERVSSDAETLSVMADGMRQPETNTQPMLASVLVSANKNWIPHHEDGRCYEGAYLDGAHWPEADLRLANFMDASLTRIHLDHADLQQARFHKSKLVSAMLRGAKLKWAHFVRTDLSRADLSHADAELTEFTHVTLAHAKLTGTNLAYARLHAANLSHANFSEARLCNANLYGSECLETDFSRVDFTKAHLNELDLRTAKLDGANFEGAHFSKANLEYINLPDAKMPGVDFSEAWLTGSILMGANLREAELSHAGLAEIEWEYADLRGANFTGVSFNLGTTRTGHVNSTIACEGSKTGFYTDEYYEQSFRAPETIRKASLRGADLRGANLQDADFYLVDLRDAQIDAWDLPHLRRCGAILEQKKYGKNA